MSTTEAGLPPAFMAALNVRGRDCVVVGGDETALARARLLLEGGARVRVVAAHVVDELRTLTEIGAVGWTARDYASDATEGAFLVITTHPDAGVQERVWQDTRARGALVNTLDRPELCDFFAPALVRRGSLQIAVSTSGESPFVAAALRERLERLIGEEWGQLTSLVGTVRRRLRRRSVPTDRQRRAYRRLLQPDVRASLREGAYAQAAALAAELVESAAPSLGSVHLVGAGPGDPGLLTCAARDLLAGADVVFHDALVTPDVLRLCGSETRIVATGKRGGAHGARQEDINAALIESARAGEHVVRLKGGDPFIFGRGGEEVAALCAAGMPVFVIPGVSSATAAPAIAGIPLTHRDLASSVGFVTAQHRGGGVTPGLEAAAAAVDTLVVLMPLANLDGVIASLSPAVGSTRAAALISGATLPEQAVVCAPLHALAEAARVRGVGAPATLVVGDVVRLSGHWDTGAAAISLGADPAPAWPCPGIAR
jgi:uroporphyrin-III C-methyltransferase / precorrin-2 dehydrogenase / sirohydrochlorin ferrochelatase